MTIKINAKGEERKRLVECIANYDRGWDVEATAEEAKLALCILLNEHN